MFEERWGKIVAKNHKYKVQKFKERINKRNKRVPNKLGR